jgi:hypothetical protein
VTLEARDQLGRDVARREEERRAVEVARPLRVVPRRRKPRPRRRGSALHQRLSFACAAFEKAIFCATTIARVPECGFS